MTVVGRLIGWRKGQAGTRLDRLDRTSCAFPTERSRPHTHTHTRPRASSVMQVVAAELAELEHHKITPATSYAEFRDGFLASRPMGFGSHSLLARGLYALQVREPGLLMSIVTRSSLEWLWDVREHDHDHACVVCTSLRTQLRPWLEAFPREQLLVLFMDDMRTPEAAHAQVAKVSVGVSL